MGEDLIIWTNRALFDLNKSDLIEFSNFQIFQSIERIIIIIIINQYAHFK